MTGRTGPYSGVPIKHTPRASDLIGPEAMQAFIDRYTEAASQAKDGLAGVAFGMASALSLNVDVLLDVVFERMAAQAATIKALDERLAELEDHATRPLELEGGQ